jgi:putative Holliday junction resolvase
MRYLGIDYGSRAVGLALSDEAAAFAFPLEVLPNDALILENVLRVIEEKNISAVVIGDTRAEGGAANTITAECERFADELEARSKLPVRRVREAWSSVEASRYAPKGRERDDAAAAAIILQRFLDTPSKKD